ncbi:MAG: hypothetical protein WCD77_14995 [Acidobacteriaceae bacterium]
MPITRGGGTVGRRRYAITTAAMAIANHPAMRHFPGNLEWEVCTRATSGATADCAGAEVVVAVRSLSDSDAMLDAGAAWFGTGGVPDWMFSTGAMNR